MDVVSLEVDVSMDVSLVMSETSSPAFSGETIGGTGDDLIRCEILITLFINVLLLHSSSVKFQARMDWDTVKGFTPLLHRWVTAAFSHRGSL